MNFTYITEYILLLIIFLFIVYTGLTFSQTKEEFITFSDINIYDKCKKAVNKRGKRYRRIINKELKKTTKKYIPIIKKQIDKLSLISL